MNIKNIVALIITGMFLLLSVGCSAQNKIDDNDYIISQEMAIDIALQKAKLNTDNIQDLVIEEKTKQELNFYVVSFNFDEIAYEYSIRCEDGFIIGHYIATLEEKDKDSSIISYDKSGIMSLKDAKKIILNEVGLDFSQVTFTSEEMKLEMGIYLYDFEFIFDTTMYETKLNAQTGDVLDFSIQSIY